MLFHTTTFAGFFAAVWLVHWVLRSKTQARLVWLTLASWGFYAAWDWRFLGLLLLSTGVDYVSARRISALEEPRARRRWMGLSLVVNLGVLAVFKYLDFFAGSLTATLESLGMHADWVSLNLVLPLGISFYTFQTLGYTIDVYRGRSEPADDPWAFAAYVAFFPQLVAGPIERASRLLPQLRADPRFDLSDQLEGARRFVIGLWKKLIIADNLAVYVDWVFVIDSDQVAPYQVALGVLAFAGQIWADFSGYTDMAIGLARCLGVRLRENFDAPYLARGPRDFWRRWHISLSTWLRDYLYVPLGGNRRGKVRTQINLALTMLLGGLWHGAAWTFVAWGALHGAWLALERALPWRINATNDNRRGGTVLAVLGVMATFAMVCFCWLLFRAPSFSVAMGFASVALGGLVSLGGPVDPAAWVDGAYVLHFVWPMFVLQAIQRCLGHDPEAKTRFTSPRHYVGWAIAVWAVLQLLIEPIARQNVPFVYFQF